MAHLLLVIPPMTITSTLKKSAKRNGMILGLLLGAGLFAACDAQQSQDPVDEAIPAGKLDDYRSTLGYEYDVKATAKVTLAGDDAKLTGKARLDRAKELAKKAVNDITKALDSKLMEIWDKSDRKYESVTIMLRQDTFTFDDLAADSSDANLYTFTYKGQAAAPTNLLTKLPLELIDAKRVLVVELGSGDDKTKINLSFSQTAESPDAYPRYLELFKGGLDIAIQVGGDYNDARYDISEAKEIYTSLESLGLKSPVASFDDLKIDSAAFTGKLKVGEKQIDIRVRLIHPDMAPDTELDKLINVYKALAKTSDVVYYVGHAGLDASYSGVVVHYNPRRAIKATEFRNLDLPEKYQLFVFAGCETYSHYADQLYAHPKKTTANLDVVTTVNYTKLSRGAERVKSFIDGLIKKGSTDDQWAPRTWGQLLKPMNAATTKWLEIFGVHGLEDNPRLSPLALPGMIGDACVRPSDCPGADTRCVKLADDRKVCGGGCADNSACPTGFSCRNINTGWWPGPGKLKQCLPKI